MNNTNKLTNLIEGDIILFGFNYNGGEPNFLLAEQISFVGTDYFIVHFMWGHHSLAETVYFEDVIGFHDVDGDTEIFGNKFQILQPDHKLVLQNKMVVGDETEIFIKNKKDFDGGFTGAKFVYLEKGKIKVQNYGK